MYGITQSQQIELVQLVSHGSQAECCLEAADKKCGNWPGPTRGRQCCMLQYQQLLVRVCASHLKAGCCMATAEEAVWRLPCLLPSPCPHEGQHRNSNEMARPG